MTSGGSLSRNQRDSAVSLLAYLLLERLPKGWMGLSSDIGAHKITQQRALSAAHVEQVSVEKFILMT
jgi:hypothetical protein